MRFMKSFLKYLLISLAIIAVSTSPSFADNDVLINDGGIIATLTFSGGA